MRASSSRAAPAATGDQPLGMAPPIFVVLGRAVRWAAYRLGPRAPPYQGISFARVVEPSALNFIGGPARRWRADPPRSRRRRSAHAPAAMEAGGTSTSASGARFRARNSKRSAGRQCGRQRTRNGRERSTSKPAQLCVVRTSLASVILPAPSPSRGARGLSPRCHHCSRAKERHWRCSTPPYSRGRRTKCHAVVVAGAHL